MGRVLWGTPPTAPVACAGSAARTHARPRWRARPAATPQGTATTATVVHLLTRYLSAGSLVHSSIHIWSGRAGPHDALASVTIVSPSTSQARSTRDSSSAEWPGCGTHTRLGLCPLPPSTLDESIVVIQARRDRLP
jgi:hypothetical protein